MIRFVSGDFFEFDADIMVNTVNCVGVMGAGVALAFKKRFPEMFADYVKKCKTHEIRPGYPAVWIHNDIITKPIEIINFPTKNDWKNPSEYSYVEDGLIWLSKYLENKPGKKVTLPALGCGHGGLSWEKVKLIITHYLKDSPAEIFVFAPSDSVTAGELIRKAHNREKAQSHDNILAHAGIGKVEPTSNNYPTKLKLYTAKDLLFYPKNDPVFSYDFSLICSTKPSDKEISLIQQFAEFCALHGKSVLLGSSAFEKKLLLKLSNQGVTCGCMLPSGIYDSSQKLKSNFSSDRIRLLSIGDPITKFDKKEFLPSVLGRIHLSATSIFFTEKLAWVSKFQKLFLNDKIDSYYCNWNEMSQQDIEAAKAVGAKNLELGLLSENFKIN